MPSKNSFFVRRLQTGTQTYKISKQKDNIFIKFASQITSTYSALFGQVQDIVFLPGGDEFVSAAEVVKRNSTDKGIMVWDFRSTAVLSNQIYQVHLQH